MSVIETKKMCINCGYVFEGDEIEEHKESNDCPSTSMVRTY